MRDLLEPGLDGATAARWFAGESVADDERRALVDAMARALVRAGVRLLPSMGVTDEDLHAILRDVLLRHADAWDELHDALEGQAWPLRAEDGPWARLACFRLAAIDLAVRVAGARGLARHSSVRGEGLVWSVPRRAEGLMERARAALERPERPDDERTALWEGLEAGLLRLVEEASEALERPDGPSGAEVVELVQQGTRAVAARWLVERLRVTETDPLWAADLRAVCGSWSERLGACVRGICGQPHPELALHGIVERARQRGMSREEVEALRAELLWVVQADRAIDGVAPMRQASHDDELPFVLPIEEHSPVRARAIQRDFMAAQDELDGTLEHGRRALALAPDDPELLASVGAMLAERACECRYPGWEYHVDVGLALLRRATQIDPRWDRPWVEIGIVLAAVGERERARAWLESIPHDVPVTQRRLRCRAALHRLRGRLE